MMQAIAKGSPKVVNPLSFMAELDSYFVVFFPSQIYLGLLLVICLGAHPTRNNTINWDACHCVHWPTQAMHAGLMRIT